VSEADNPVYEHEYVDQYLKRSSFGLLMLNLWIIWRGVMVARGVVGWTGLPRRLRLLAMTGVVAAPGCWICWIALLACGQSIVPLGTATAWRPAPCGLVRCSQRQRRLRKGELWLSATKLSC